MEGAVRISDVTDDVGEAELSPPRPIFVLGTARSGTTWLGNLLIDHPQVAGVAALEHHGMVESHLFDHTRYAMPGVMTAGEFLARYSTEDYFRAMGTRPDANPLSGIPGSHNVAFWFRVLMDSVARRS